jgi:flagellum-specific ATP synthase
MIARYGSRLDVITSRHWFEVQGTVEAVRGLALHVRHLAAPIGSRVRIEGSTTMHGEVVGFDADVAIVMLDDAIDGVEPGCTVSTESDAGMVPIGPGLIGRVLDGLGRPIDGRGPLRDIDTCPLHSAPIDPMERSPIDVPLPTGVRSIDGLLTIGRGQRVGIFSGAGVGKSTLLGTIARDAASDVAVIALIGERGREASDFIERALGPEGLARSVVIVSTGDEPPLRRVRATHLAMTIAEGFRSSGADVLLGMDSITRYARALRQLALACGEAPATRGFPASVFARLPVLLERAGNLRNAGSITGLFTVLVEGDDLTDPIADAAMGVLDGHIVLSRAIASRGRFPAVDPIASVSRLADAVCDDNHIAARREVLRLLGAWTEVEDLVSIGAYAGGADPVTDAAIELRPMIETWLTQLQDEPAAYPEICRQLVELATTSVRLQQVAATTGQVGTT